MAPAAPDDLPGLQRSERHSGQRGTTITLWIGAALATAGSSVAAVLAWTDRFHGWILLPLVVVTYSGVALGYVTRRRLPRDGHLKDRLDKAPIARPSSIEATPPVENQDSAT